LAIYIDFVTAPYAAPVNSLAMLFFYSGLLLKSAAVPIATLMSRLLTGYAVLCNHRHGRHGHVFQNRYKSILCQEDVYFKELVRYIHLNPLRAGLVADLPALSHYAYAGHGVLAGDQTNDWQNSAAVLKLFGTKAAPCPRAVSALCGGRC